MITPVTEEDEWSHVLSDLPPFVPGEQPIVVISPHPDDETLAVGGLIAAQSIHGRDVVVIAITDGENAYGKSDDLGCIRKREQESAVDVLSSGAARVVRLGLPDSSVGSNVPLLTHLLSEHITHGCHVISPWVGDYHPDHIASGQAAFEAATRAKAQLSWWFFWTWHRGTPSDLQHLDLRKFHLSHEEADRKAQALRCHGSQLQHPSGEPILPNNLLLPAQRAFEVFAPAC